MKTYWPSALTVERVDLGVGVGVPAGKRSLVASKLAPFLAVAA
jgi:hypothetical protein